MENEFNPSFVPMPKITGRRKEYNPADPFSGFDPSLVPMPEEPEAVQSVRRNVSMNEESPERFTEYFKLSQKTGMSIDMIRANEGNVKQDIKRTEFTGKVVDMPGMQKYFAVPENYGVSQDDIEALGELEGWFKQNKEENTAARTIKAVGKQSALFFPRLAISAYDTSSLLAGGLDNAARNISTMTGLSYGGAFRDMRDSWASTSTELSDFWLNNKYLRPSDKVAGKLIYDEPALLLDPEFWVNSIGEAASSLVPAVVAAYATGGGAVAAASVGAVMEASNFYTELINDGADDNKALAGSYAFGAVSGLLNRLSFDRMLDKTTASTIAKRIGKAFATGTTEGLTEYAEEGAQGLIGGLTKYGISQETINEFTKSLKEGLNVIPGSFATGGGFGYINTRIEYQKAQQAKQDMLVFEALSENAENSKTRKRLPEAYEKAVKTIREENGGAIQNIYIEPEELRQAFRDTEMLYQKLEQIGITEEQFTEAQALDKDIIIPVEKWQAYMAATPEGKSLLGSIRWREDGYSDKQATEFESSRDEYITRIYEEETARTKAEAENDTIFSEARDLFITRAKDAGIQDSTARANADVFDTAARTFVSRYGQQTGITAQQIVDNILPEIRKEKFQIAKKEGFSGVEIDDENFGHSVLIVVPTDIKDIRNPALNDPDKTLNPKDPRMMYQQAEQRDTGVTFKEWIKDSVVKAPVFHGSPAMFEQFDYKKIGTQGTAEGKGFYFTDKKSVAQGYAQDTENLYEVYLNITKPLSFERKTISKTNLKKFIKALDPDGTDYLLNWGDVEYEGYNNVLNTAVDGEYSPSDNDVDLVSSIIAAAGNIENVYRVLTETLGYDGIVVRNPSWGEGQTVYVAFYPEQIKSVNNPAVSDESATLDPYNPRMLFQRNDGSPRGSVNMFSFGETQPIIKLFEGANESTLLHETSHIWFQFLEQIEARPNAPQALIEDMAVLREHVGNDGSPFTTEQHEKLARSIEQYFREGKSPSSKLAAVFQKFAAWLKAIYRRAEQLNAEITPEVRAMFDRLFATDAEIEDTKRFYEAQSPFFDTAAEIETEELAAYEKKRSAADISAADKRYRNLTQAYNQAMAKEYMRQATAEIKAMPLYALVDDAVKMGGISRDDLDLTIGADTRKKITAKYKKLTISEDKATEDTPLVDELVAKHGFGSVSEFASELIDSPTKTEAIKQRVAQLKEQAAQDIAAGLKDEELRSQAEKGAAADEEYHSNQRMAVLVAELQILQQKQNRSTARRVPEISAARAAARDILAKKPVKDAIDHYQYARAERKASQKAKDSIRKGNFTEAENWKRKELLNHAMVLEAISYRAQIDKDINVIKKSVSNASALPESNIQVRDIAIRFGILGKSSGESLVDSVNRIRRSYPDKTQTLDQWVIETVNEKGYPVLIDDFVLNRDYIDDYRNLTVEQMNSVADAVRSIMTVDRNEREYIASGKKVAIEQVVSELEESIDRYFKRKNIDPKKQIDKTKVRIALDAADHVDAVHKKLEFVFVALDGEKHGGAWWTYFYKPLADAVNQRDIRIKKENKSIRGIFDNYYSKLELQSMMIKKTEIPAVDSKFTKNQILSIALNTGNSDNRMKLMDGYGFTEEQLNAVLDTLDARDWQFVQDVWDYIDTFRDESFALHRDMTGTEPKRVMPDPVYTKYGALRGGYYPIRFDRKLSYKAFAREQKDLANTLFGGQNYGTAATKQAHLKTRSESAGGQPISLDLSVITDHVFDVVHDITHRRAVVNVAKLLRRDDVRAMVEETFGMEVYKRFMPWLQDIARETQKEPMDYMHRAANWARAGTSIMQMGFKITTMVQQPLGYLQTVDELGAVQAAKGLNMFYGSGNRYSDIGDRIDFVMRKSAFMNSTAE